MNADLGQYHKSLQIQRKGAKWHDLGMEGLENQDHGARCLDDSLPYFTSHGVGYADCEFLYYYEWLAVFQDRFLTCITGLGYGQPD